MRVVNIGSLNIDRTYSVRKFVKPNETIKALGYEEFCGGKGLNQSVSLARAGADVWHAGHVGQDGDKLIQTLRSAGVRTDFVEKISGVSGHAVIQINEDGDNNIIICGGSNDYVSREFIARVLDHFGEGDLLLLQNEISNIDFAIEEAKCRGMLVALNPSPIGENLSSCRLELVDYFILNEIEGQELSRTSSSDAESVLEGLQGKYPNASFVLTLGAKGCIYSDRDTKVFQDIFKVPVLDTTGAGDTFCGFFIEGLCRGLDSQENLRRASAASAVAIGKKGASSSIPTDQEVHNFILANQ